MATQGDEFTGLIERFKNGCPDAAEELWEAFSGRLEAYARRKLGGFSLRDSDEEDVTISAMSDFTQGVRNDRFPDLSSEDHLLRVLFVIADRKCKKRIRRHRASIRGSGRVSGESVFMTLDGEGDGISQVADEKTYGSELLSQECIELLDRLGDDQLRRVAVLRVQGYSTSEIAEQLDVSTRTVDRALAKIRGLWHFDLEGDPSSEH